MKNKYSHYHSSLKKLSKRYKMNIDEAFTFCRAAINRNVLDEYVLNEREKEQQLFSLYSDYQYLKGNSLNIFIDNNDLFDFFTKTEINSCDTIDDFLSNLPNELININDTASSIAIHHKHNNTSWLFSLLKGKDDYGYTMTASNGNGVIEFKSIELESKLKTIENKITISNLIKTPKFSPLKEYKEKPYRLFINILFYVKAFPDKLKNGVPKDFRKTPNLYDGNKFFKLDTEESLIERRNGVLPHFRTGHFRTLKSDRFKNKKGQVIWINSTVVKGYDAKTVIK